MLVVCAWCKTELGEKWPLEDKQISHAICLHCLKKEAPERFDAIVRRLEQAKEERKRKDDVL